MRTLHTVLRADPAGGDGGAAALTLAEIVKAVGLSRPTVEDVVETLVGQGWLDEHEPAGARGAGRPARRFGFRAAAGHAVGIDVAPDWVTVLVTDLLGEVVARHRAATSPDMDASARLDAVRRSVTRAFARAPAADRGVLGATVATTGIVDASGRVVRSNLPGWTGLDLTPQIEQLVAGPATVENDMRAGAVAEHWIGAAIETDNVVYLHAGPRIGTGFVIDSGIPRGRHGASGELTRAAAMRVLKAYRRLAEQLPSTGRADDADRTEGALPDARPLFRAAARGDEPAVAAVQAFSRELVASVEHLIVALDPDVVVIGGSLALAGEVVTEPIRRHLAQACVFEPRVEASPLGDDSVALGAVRIALNEIEGRLFLTGTG